MKKISIAIGIVLFIISCSPKTIKGTGDLKINTTNLKKDNKVIPNSDIWEGKSLYEKKCNRCHELKKIADYSESQWANILPDMSKKSNLDKNQESLINNFITWEIQK